ncbi:hypothetical protein AN640_08760 [Candidatus Epulonipiscium fishelsonii]|uniref:Uncharacterized protein n=1 Tax=Candidatus Epulonipiscium fishelsonii TaxID=77094 RepID=A0ACC8XCC0_9FIRM|nr:hypothetical protein AN640_08760 [Epulopiscium sp. SCG-D08WGA-EpuloA1]OON92456.1 MAG: hypothetical protein ATN32_09680 [Epulopiscium sp. AS2M-Bin002]
MKLIKNLFIVIIGMGVIFTIGTIFKEENADAIYASEPSDSDIANDEMPSTGTESNSQEKVLEEPSKIEETIIYDKDNIKIIAKEIYHKGFFGPEIKLLFENNTDENIIFTADDCVVNGYMVSTSMFVEVASGKKANDSLKLMDSDLKKSAIDKFTNIDFRLNIKEADSYDDISVNNLISLTTNYAGKYTQEYNDSGNIIYEDNEIKVVSKGILNRNDDKVLRLYIENNSNNAINIRSENVSANNFMMDNGFDELNSSLLPGTKIIDEITFSKSFLEENHIDKLELIETNLKFSKNYKEIGESGIINIRL